MTNQTLQHHPKGANEPTSEELKTLLDFGVGGKSFTGRFIRPSSQYHEQLADHNSSSVQMASAPSPNVDARGTQRITEKKANSSPAPYEAPLDRPSAFDQAGIRILALLLNIFELAPGQDAKSAAQRAGARIEFHRDAATGAIKSR